MNNNQNYRLNTTDHIEKLTIKQSTVQDCKIRYFVRKNNLFTSGIEFWFSQDGISFTTVLLLKDFFYHPLLTFKTVLNTLVDKTITLHFEGERFGQFPYFEITEIFADWKQTNNRLGSTDLNEIVYYHGNDLLDGNFKYHTITPNDEHYLIPYTNNLKLLTSHKSKELTPLRVSQCDVYLQKSFEDCLVPPKSFVDSFIVLTFYTFNNPTEILFDAIITIGIFCRQIDLSLYDLINQIQNKHINNLYCYGNDDNAYVRNAFKYPAQNTGYFFYAEEIFTTFVNPKDDDDEQVNNDQGGNDGNNGWMDLSILIGNHFFQQAEPWQQFYEDKNRK